MNPSALYDENPDPPLQFQFCGGDGSLVPATDGSHAVMKPSEDQWKSNLAQDTPGPLIRD